MKKTLLSIAILAVSVVTFAQSDIIAAIGSDAKKIAFENFSFVDVTSNSNRLIITKNAEFPDQVVGMSYDTNRQKVIFVGMYSPDIYTYDLTSSEFTKIYASGRANSRYAIGEQFSRMGTLSNGVTYALNNNSTQLVEIKPVGNHYTVKELGALNSDANLGQYKFFGGDLIADELGNLYLISAHSNVVKINPKDMSASFLGKITGLENGFTTNGSAVMADGNILLSNAQGKGFYTLDFNTLQAKRLQNESQPIYDLASPYLLKDDNNAIASNSYMTVYPTKVTDRQITVSLKNKMTGMGQISIYDYAGNELMNAKMNLADAQNPKTLNLNSLSPGNYFLKVTDFKGQELMNEKFVLIR